MTQPGHRAGLAPPNAGRKWPPELLSPAEARRLLGQPSRRAPTGIRNRALIAVLWRGGLRVSEALALAPRDIDAGSFALAVRHGKGDRHRTVGMDPAAFGLLERWLEERRRLGLSRAPVFCTLQGRALRASYVRTLLPRLARKAGIDKRVHPHGLRHTCAAELAVEGVPVNLIQAQLGAREPAYNHGVSPPDRPCRAARGNARPRLDRGPRLMPVGLLSAAQRERLSRFPDDVSPGELRRYFELSEDELAAVRSVRGATNRLGFALQLCALRLMGFAPDELQSAPAQAVAFLGLPGRCFSR